MFKLQFSTANSAFDTDANEIARILRELANKVERGVIIPFTDADGTQLGVSGSIRDINGNTIGNWILTPE